MDPLLVGAAAQTWWRTRVEEGEVVLLQPLMGVELLKRAKPTHWEWAAGEGEEGHRKRSVRW